MGVVGDGDVVVSELELIMFLWCWGWMPGELQRGRERLCGGRQGRCVEFLLSFNLVRAEEVEDSVWTITVPAFRGGGGAAVRGRAEVSPFFASGVGAAVL